MKHTKNKGGNSSNSLSSPPSKGKGDRGKGKGSVDSSLTANIKAGSKDKDRRDSAGNSSEKELRGDSIDLKDCPLRLPEFANVDHAKLVPRYTSVLRRSEHDGIGLEDVDTLQLELEALLSATVVRKFTLKEETKVLSNIEKYKSGGKLHKKGPPSPGKRGISSKDIRSIKKLKTNNGKPIEPKVIGIPKLKSDSGGPSFDPLQNEQIRPPAEASKPALPKNETPSRFWAFVEPYCKDVTQNDVKLLEDLIKTHSDMSEYFRIPKLGQHYTLRWAAEDMEYERAKSNGNNDTENTDRNNTSAANEVDRMLKNGESANDKTPYGELTQRLVAGLIEDNLMTAVEDSMDTGKKQDVDSSEKSKLIKSLNISNNEALEARVKKELQDQGILDPNDDNEDNSENDEIHEELLRCQAELKAISAHNLQQLKRLTKAAKEEMARQELRNKLSHADQDVMEAYKKISAARSKKKPPTKKEREQAWKALKEREIILKQLESI